MDWLIAYRHAQITLGLPSSLEVLTLAASAPYSEGVFMTTARRSTMPQLWRVFATAMAPMSSTSEKMSVSMIMGLGLSSVDRQSAVTNSETRRAIQRSNTDGIAKSSLDAHKPCLDVLRGKTPATTKSCFAS
jgi:hypothetical protein